MMVQSSITFEQAKVGGSLFWDYCKNNSSIRPLYAFEPSWLGVEQAIRQREQFPVDRTQLHEVFNRQYSGLHLSLEVQSNIDKVLHNNTFTITTGHQLSLMTGPLYFIYKIVSVIAFAKQCQERFPSYNFVPVYWMNSEDHDFEEINHFYWGKDKFEWNRSDKTPFPTGELNTQSLDFLFNQLNDKTIDKQLLNKLLNEYKDCYLNADNLAQATRKLVHSLFKDWGLLIIDQHDETLKKQFKKHIINEIKYKNSCQYVTETDLLIHDLGYNTQVKPREINLFYHHPQLGRHRIIEEENRFKVINTELEFTLEELIQSIDFDINKVSTNVVTRPLYQECVLPNICYIGGPAEVAYWLQYKKNFEASHIFYPMILMRDSFLLMDEKKNFKISKLNLQLKDFLKEESEIINQWIKKFTDYSSISKIQSDVDLFFDQLKSSVIEIDSTLGTSVEAERVNAKKGLERIVLKMNRAVKRKNEEGIRQISEIHQWIMPDGTFQERSQNLFHFTSNPNNLITYLISQSNVMDFKTKVIPF